MCMEGSALSLSLSLPGLRRGQQQGTGPDRADEGGPGRGKASRTQSADRQATDGRQWNNAINDGPETLHGALIADGPGGGPKDG